VTSSGRTFTDLILQMERWGERPCFSYLPDGDVIPAETLSYAQVLDRSRRFAAALADRGLRPGDRVAFFAQPTANYLTALFGTILAGGVAAPINHNFKSAELSAYLAYLKPAVVLYDRDSKAIVTNVGEIPSPWVALSIDPADSNHPAGLDWAEWQPSDPRDAQPDDVAMILHTSGTTALPKGVERTQGAMRWFADRLTRLFFRERDTLLCYSPLYHQSGTLAATFSMIAAGGHTIQWQRFSASRFWEVVDRNRVTVSNLIPPGPTYLLAQPPSEMDRCHSLEWVLLGGRTDHWSEFQERFGVVGHSNYGSTEMGFVTSTGERDTPAMGPDILLRAAPHYVAGPVCPEFDLRIMGPDGPSAPGEPGEIQVRGPTVFQRYFGSPDLTREAFDDGWFRTGDVGFLSDRGELFMMDRAKDVIRRSSENISPLEIELALSSHPAVAECVAVGVPDPVRGPAVMVCLVLEPGAAPEVDELFAYSADRLANFKVPRFIEIWTDFPRTGTMKVRKEQLRRDNPQVVRHDRLAATVRS